MTVKENDIRPQKIFDEYLEICRRDIPRYFGAKDRFVDVPCPACREKPSGKFFVKDSFRYNDCLNCKTLFVSPRPTQRMIDNYYLESESSKFWATTFYKETEDARREKLVKPKVTILSHIVKKHGLKCDSFLDIGAGYGTFCEEVRERGVASKITALEPSKYLAEVLREKKLTVLESTVETVEKDHYGKVDLALSLELFEHLFSLETFLHAVWKILKPGGIFVYSTLSGTGWDILVLGSQSKSVSPPHHLNFVNPGSSKNLSVRLGWEVVEIFTPGLLDVDIVRNMYFQNKQIEIDPFARHIILQEEKTRQNFQKFLSENNQSSHMWVVLKKPKGG